MQDLDSNLRLKTSAVEDIYLCAALDFDLNHSWLLMAFEVLSIIIQGIIHVIITVASLFASMDSPGNTIYVSDSKHVQLFQLAYQPCAFHKH